MIPLSKLSDIHFPFAGPPTTITNLTDTGTTSTTITVRWNRPTTTGRGDYYYVVEYTDPDGVGEVYIQDNSRLVNSNVQVTYTVDGADGSGLQADTPYIIRVSVHNGVSDLDGENADDRRQQVQVTTPEGGTYGIAHNCIGEVLDHIMFL